VREDPFKHKTECGVGAPEQRSLNNDEHIPPRGKPLPQVAEAGKLARKAIYAEDSNRPYTPEKLGKRRALDAANPTMGVLPPLASLGWPSLVERGP
jgi:hypothetical protein